MLEQDEGKARFTWRDYQRMLCCIHHISQAKPKRVNRAPKIALAAAHAFARNEIDRAELMRRITPSPALSLDR